MGQQHVFVGNISVGVETDGSDVVGSPEGLFIEGLYIFEHVSEAKITGIELIGSQSIKHEGIV